MYVGQTMLKMIIRCVSSARFLGNIFGYINEGSRFTKRWMMKIGAYHHHHDQDDYLNHFFVIKGRKVLKAILYAVYYIFTIL